MIKSLVGKKNGTDLLDFTPFDFVKSKKGILKEILISKQTGKLLGVYSRALGEGMFLTGVEDIESHGRNEVIVFNRYDMSGHILARTRVELDEIQTVCPFNKAFQNPILTSAKANKHWNSFKFSNSMA